MPVETDGREQMMISNARNNLECLQKYVLAVTVQKGGGGGGG